MPELPDLTVYAEGLDRVVVGKTLERVRMPSFFLMRTYDPPASTLQGKAVRHVRRIGKHIVLSFDDDLHFVLHLMLLRRLHWKKRGAATPP